jgi:phenylalanyl-tRNA synthetase beta chain
MKYITQQPGCGSADFHCGKLQESTPSLADLSPANWLISRLMKIAYGWLKSMADFDADPEALDSILTKAGLEVEHIEAFENVKGGLEGLVIGKVCEVKPHPNADRLRCTIVQTSESDFWPIVCGASNVAEGQMVIVALPGTTIYPAQGEPFTIREAKIRGEKSNGMICAEDEIGIGKSHDGIVVLPADAPLGGLFADYYGVHRDTVIEIGLTPNRGDAASHHGILRELQAHIAVKRHHLPEAAWDGPAVATAQVEDPAQCTQYHALLIRNVKVDESPAWLKRRLQSIGISPINNIVDCTNYVLHETGQPIHAFDAARVAGHALEVRRAKAGETLTTLDKTARTMKGGELVIADREKLLALAGVFGGLDSGVQPETVDILIESACFDAALVRKTARMHGLSTDASFRFERGSDPDACLPALRRVAALILETAGGEISSAPASVIQPVSRRSLQLRRDFLQRLSGTDIPAERTAQILSDLGFEPLADAAGWQVQVPSWRSDIEGEADLVEEVLRVFGYDEIPMPGRMQVSLSGNEGRYRIAMEAKVREFLNAHGFHETMNSSLTRADYYAPETPLVKLNNPLSNDLAVMRGSLLWQALETVAYNRNRQAQRIRLFELGRTYRLEGQQTHESRELLILTAGERWPETWEIKGQRSDIYDLKAIVAGLLSRLGISEAAAAVQWLAPEREVLRRFDIQIPVFAAVLSWDKVLEAAAVKRALPEEPSRYPVTRRDLSMIVPPAASYAAMESGIRGLGIDMLREIRLFDRYEGKPLEPGEASWAMSFYFGYQDRTLTDIECDAAMEKIATLVENSFQAKIRRG